MKPIPTFDDKNALSRIVVTSIGSARPAAAAALSKGLGLPPEQVVACLYKAPSVLVDRVKPDMAGKLGELLTTIGLGIRIDDASAPAPEPEPAHDVALHVTDARRVIDVVAALAAFLGCTPDKAMELMVTPPGLVLGGVSLATVDSLRERLPADAVEVVASRCDSALYELFMADAPAVVRDSLRRDLQARRIEVLDVGGLIASGLDYQTGTMLWRRHQASGAIRLVNRDFQRFDLVLTGGTAEPEACAALTRLAGVPEDIAPALFTHLPITLEEGVRYADLPSRLDAYAAANLAVVAELTTFQYVGVAITAAEDRSATAQALADFGLMEPDTPLPPLPYAPPQVLPELQARMLRAALEPLGAAISFTEAAR